MIDFVLRFSLQNRAIVVIVSLLLLLYGSWVAVTLPIDLFPDLDRPRVVVITECRGLATEEAETLVTLPIEIALLGASGVLDVRSQTTTGLSVITIEFDWSTDISKARQTVQERLVMLSGTLGEGILPQMTPTSSIMGQIVIAGISWKPDSQSNDISTDSEQSIAKQMDLRTLADWVVRPRLRQIPGVAEVFVQGGHRKQYQILVDPAALLEYGISLEQVEQALGGKQYQHQWRFCN